MECISFLPTCGIRDTNVHLAIETAEPAESSVNAVGSVSGSHDNDVGSLLQSVHQSQQLGDNPSLHLTMSLPAHTHTHTGATYVTYSVCYFEFTLSLLGAIASSSSMKMIAGAFFSASSKAVHTKCYFQYTCPVFPVYFQYKLCMYIMLQTTLSDGKRVKMW